METFSFVHDGRIRLGHFEVFEAEGQLRYRVTLGQESFVILPTELMSKSGKIIWVRLIDPGDAVLSHAFVQSIGEGIFAEN